MVGGIKQLPKSSYIPWFDDWRNRQNYASEPRKTKSIEQANELKFYLTWTEMDKFPTQKHCTLILKNKPKIYQFI